MTCRCGWDGAGDHPCHRCHQRPGTSRLYNPHITCLAGVQMKLGAYETWGCDECWSAFKARQWAQAGPAPAMPDTVEKDDVVP